MAQQTNTPGGNLAETIYGIEAVLIALLRQAAGDDAQKQAAILADAQRQARAFERTEGIGPELGAKVGAWIDGTVTTAFRVK